MNRYKETRIVYTKDLYQNFETINPKHDKTMKKRNCQIDESSTSNSCKRKNRKVTRKQAEANARRKVAKEWAVLAHGVKYQKAATKESCKRTTLLMEEELFDGILLNLREKNSKKSYHAQKRILRRIVEKRQAQQTHRSVGRSKDCFSRHMLRHCISKSMNDLYHFQLCA